MSLFDNGKPKFYHQSRSDNKNLRLLLPDVKDIELLQFASHKETEKRRIAKAISGHGGAGKNTTTL